MRCERNNEDQHSSALSSGTSSCDGEERVPDEQALEEEGWLWLKARLTRDHGTNQMSLGSPWPGPSHSCHLLLVFQSSKGQPCNPGPERPRCWHRRHRAGDYKPI